MGLRIPQNQIVYKYTSGKEYLIEATYQEYQGYYYEFNGKTYAGKEYNNASPTLIKIKSDNINKLLINPATFLYGLISKKKIIKNNKVNSISNEYSLLRFFYKKYNDNIIKETDEKGYKSLQSQPIYQTTFIGTYNGKTQTIEQANQQVPGVKAFLSV